MMSVGYVKVGYLFKLLLKERSFFSSTSPKNMSHSIIAGDIGIAGTRSNFLNFSFHYFLIFSKGQKYGTNVCILDISKFCSILFFFSESEFMFFYSVVFVIFYAR